MVCHIIHRKHLGHKGGCIVGAYIVLPFFHLYCTAYNDDDKYHNHLSSLLLHSSPSSSPTATTTTTFSRSSATILSANMATYAGAQCCICVGPPPNPSPYTITMLLLLLLSVWSCLLLLPAVVFVSSSNCTTSVIIHLYTPSIHNVTTH